jgi:dynactin-5
LTAMSAPIYYSKAEYIETDTGNKVSRRATISGPQNIILGGKTIIANGAIIRGDLRRVGPGHAVVISLGRYCLIGDGCVMRFKYSSHASNLRPIMLTFIRVDPLTRRTAELSTTIP